MGQLDRTYCVQYFDSDTGMLGTPDVDQRTVAQALRLRLTSAENLKEEFEDNLERREWNPVSTDDAVREAETARIRNMSDDERQDFWLDLKRAQGCTVDSRGNVCRKRSGRGDSTYGFAIDPVSLETVVVGLFGHHDSAPRFLASRLEVMGMIRRCFRNSPPVGDADDGDDGDRESSLISGLICTRVRGFTLPILCLQTADAEPEDIRRIIGFLVGERKCVLSIRRGIFWNREIVVKRSFLH